MSKGETLRERVAAIVDEACDRVYSDPTAHHGGKVASEAADRILAIPGLRERTPLEPANRDEIRRWRDDAFEAAAQIVERYGADPQIATNIRALCGTPSEPVGEAGRDWIERIIWDAMWHRTGVVTEEEGDCTWDEALEYEAEFGDLVPQVVRAAARIRDRLAALRTPRVEGTGAIRKLLSDYTAAWDALRDWHRTHDRKDAEHERWNRRVVEAEERIVAALRSESGEVEATKLRRLLWLRHGCPIASLYGDDGEMSCGQCRIDFKRMTADQIDATWKRDALRAARQSEGGSSA